MTRAYTCPRCGSEAYLCTAEHTDGPGARLHCRSASLHNFPAPSDTPTDSDALAAPAAATAPAATSSTQ